MFELWVSPVLVFIGMSGNEGLKCSINTTEGHEAACFKSVYVRFQHT
jgi:hypothetical protein